MICIFIGSGVFELEATNVTHENWKTIIMQRTEKNIILTVDDKSVTGVMPGFSTNLNILSSIWLGGIPEHSDSRLAVTEGFKGCIRYVKVGLTNIYFCV